MKMYLTGLVGFLLVLTAEAGLGESEENSLCNESPQCLQFETVCKDKNFEIRRYGPVKWVCTSFSAPAWMLGAAPAFWRLKNYLDDNEIPMITAPGILEMPADDPPPKPQNNQPSWISKLKALSAKLIPKMHDYTLCFLPPMELQSNPPQPTNPKVKIVETAERYVYVRGYKDWVKSDAKEAKILLENINMTSYETSHFAVGYNRSSNESSLCTETKECLLFERVCENDTKDYEIRHYDPVKWASVSFKWSSAFWFLGAMCAFRDLKHYLDGKKANQCYRLKNNIPMETAPITMLFPEDLSQHDAFASFFTKKLTYSINFLLPSELQSNPPQPKNDRVKIVETGDMYVYVRSYKESVFKDRTEAEQLFKSLNMVNNEKPHYAVGYNCLINPEQHSEVWIVAEESHNVKTNTGQEAIPLEDIGVPVRRGL
ncbi:hypothetical protein WMY93_003794 [Mugilogobius chulae]|uniref:Heme-binding protein 2 n=1 Tax=Mugilogobius chulae TaxID=88201 RepID=A0AAW0PZA8_9GOBI